MSKILSPLERHARDLARPGFSDDPAQAEAVKALHAIYLSLITTPPKKLFGHRRLSWNMVRGLYLWGGVGRGKTYLMDGFYESLPFDKKFRTHFHRFMLDVHRRRARHAHQQDPLKLVARDYAQDFRVLCFDEFYVSDIADAMILFRLFYHLFKHGVTLIATSNTPPERLYENGLQRANFSPFIEVLKNHVTVLNVDGGVDHRLRALTAAEIYHHPCDAAAEANLGKWFDRIAPDQGRRDVNLFINERVIPARKLADGVAWFDFAALCEGPRSASDYIEIARTHQTVLLSRLPKLSAQDEDAARRFINLVDEFYDRGVNLIIAAEVPLKKLYTGDKLKFEFQRTQSRLQEMQSNEYLAREHLP